MLAVIIVCVKCEQSVFSSHALNAVVDRWGGGGGTRTFSHPRNTPTTAFRYARARVCVRILLVPRESFVD